MRPIPIRARARSAPLGALPEGVRLGVPIAGQRVFFGDRASASAYDRPRAAATLGAKIVEIDIEPFYETARLLYEGPWVAERYLVLKSLLASSPESIHPVTREIIVKGARPTAVDASRRSTSWKNCAASAMQCSGRSMRCCCRPRRRSTRSIRCWPIRSSSTAGSAPIPTSSICSNCAASPCRRRCAPDGMPFGVTLLAPDGHDALLASIGRAFHADTGLPLGALRCRSRRSRRLRPRPRRTKSPWRWSARICPACRSMAN